MSIWRILRTEFEKRSWMTAPYFGRWDIGLRLGLILSCAIVFSAILNSPATAQKAGGEVIFFRGIFGVLSTGLNEMSDQLNRKGVSSSVYHHAEWKSVADAISKARNRGGVPKIVIIGHSLGANAAVRMARRLEKANIKIDHLITLDPTVRQSIPANVIAAVNYYLPQSIWGTDLYPSDFFQGQLTNIQLATTGDFGHFNMDTDPQLKSVIEADVLATFNLQHTEKVMHRNTIHVSR